MPATLAPVLLTICLNPSGAARMNRRTLLAGAAAATLPLAKPALAQSTRARTLRFIPEGNLANADPIWTTTTVARNHGYMIYDTLFGVDAA